MKVTLKQAEADWLKSGECWLADAVRVKTKTVRVSYFCTNYKSR